MRAVRSSIALALALQLATPGLSPLFSPQVAHAQPPSDFPEEKAPARDYKKVESEIPKSPTAPQALKQPARNENFRCDRLFIYEGKSLPCDSHVRRDAENLRPILKDTPAAIEALNQYQKTRRSMRNMAYVSSFGLVLAITGLILGSPLFEKEPPPGSPPGTPGTNPSARLGTILLYSGLGVSGGSLIYTFTLSRTAESHLGRAVESYNEAHPSNPLVLQFSTGFSF